MRFQPLEKLINLRDGYRRRVKIDQLDVLILQEHGQVYIIQSRCPHQEHPLEGAEVEGRTIFCPLHHFGFDLNTGGHEGGFCRALQVWQPVFEGAEVGIVVES